MSNVPDSGMQFGEPAPEQPVRNMTMDGQTAEELYRAIRSIPEPGEDEDLPQVQIAGAAGQHNAFMRLDHPVKLRVDGSLGDYAFAFNSQTDVRLTGSAGHGVGEGMTSGVVRVRGNAGVGVGAAMSGGTLAIFKSAGDRCGAGMRGG